VHERSLTAHSGLSFIDGGASPFRWRFPIGFQIIPLLILFIIVWWFPESPRWLVKVGREEEGRFILGRLRGNEGEDKERAEAEFQDICNVASLEKQAGNLTSYWAMFTGQGSGDLHTGRRVQLVIWLQIMQEWVGIAGVTICKHYHFSKYKRNADLGFTDAPTIFRIAGFNAEKSQWISGLNNIFYMV
jgi:hypothetical protein